MPKTYKTIEPRYQAARFTGRLNDDLRAILGENKVTVQIGDVDADNVLVINTNTSYPRVLRVASGEWLVKTLRANDNDDDEGRLASMNNAEFVANYAEV